MLLSSALSFFSFTLLATQVAAHGYIKKVRADGGDWQTGQKSGASGSFREVSKNTGWVGANFIHDNKGVVCGATNTPNHAVVAPGGPFFSESSQGAKQTLDVKAGGMVTVAISGNPGDGWPHPFGNIQVWLSHCGDGHDDCRGVDASAGQWFKIQAEKDGIQNTLRTRYDSGLDGHLYDIKIPKAVKEGSYIMRLELIAFGQSGGDEGGQDQYYPFCGQVFIKGGASSMPNYKTVMFPGAYENGNIDRGTLPGPAPLELASGGSSTPAPAPDGNGAPQGGESAPPPNVPSSSGDCGATTTAVPQCAGMCIGVKISEHATLAPSCAASNVECMCKEKKFRSAFDRCVTDHCGAETAAGQAAFDSLCSTGGKMMRRAAKRDAAARRRSSLLSFAAEL